MNVIKQELISNALNIVRTYITIDALKINMIDEDKNYLDAMLTLKYYDHNKIIYRIEVKQNITNLQQISLIRETCDNNTLIICRGLSKAISEKMIQNKIQFIDTFGNIYIENKDFLIYSTGKINSQNKIHKTAGRAFSKTGLKTTFQFILDPDLVNKNYRSISNVLDVSLGSLKWIFYHLKNEQLILSYKHGERRLNNKKELINKWIPAYKEKLRPSLLVGKYRLAMNHTNWRTLLDDIEETYWGCEPAVSLLNNYLKPEIFTIYSNKPEFELIKTLKLVSDENRNIEMIRTYWNLSYFNFSQVQNNKIVPTFLIYTDFVNSGISRNLEVAELLRLKNDF